MEKKFELDPLDYKILEILTTIQSGSKMRLHIYGFTMKLLNTQFNQKGGPHHGWIFK